MTRCTLTWSIKWAHLDMEHNLICNFIWHTLSCFAVFWFKPTKELKTWNHLNAQYLHNHCRPPCFYVCRTRSHFYFWRTVWSGIQSLHNNRIPIFNTVSRLIKGSSNVEKIQNWSDHKFLLSTDSNKKFFSCLKLCKIFSNSSIINDPIPVGFN